MISRRELVYSSMMLKRSSIFGGDAAVGSAGVASWLGVSDFPMARAPFARDLEKPDAARLIHVNGNA